MGGGVVVIAKGVLLFHCTIRTIGFFRVLIMLHGSLFSKKLACLSLLNLSGYGRWWTLVVFNTLTFLARTFPDLLLMSTRAGSNTSFGETTSTRYDPGGTPWISNSPLAFKKPRYLPPSTETVVFHSQSSDSAPSIVTFPSMVCKSNSVRSVFPKVSSFSAEHRESNSPTRKSNTKVVDGPMPLQTFIIVYILVSKG